MSETNKKPLAVIMILSIIALVVFGVSFNNQQSCAAQAGDGAGAVVAQALVVCSDGRMCPAAWECCDLGCCGPPTNVSAILKKDDDMFKPWYSQWAVLFLLATLTASLLCCLWCTIVKQSTTHDDFLFLSCSCCCIPRRRQDSMRNSSGSLYPPPRYSRCGSFHQAPPPYSEVTSKPDHYPLVITCAGTDGKQANTCVLQVRRPATTATGHVPTAGGDTFTRYDLNLIQHPCSLSATSTVESLNSSFLCNATNEANSLIPPPYSCAVHYEDCVSGGPLLRSVSSLAALRSPRAPPRSRTAPDPAPRNPHTQVFRDNLITSPVQPLDPAFDLELELIDCEMYCDGGCKPRLGASPPAHRSPLPPDPQDGSPCDREAYGLRHLFPETSGTCESPPQPTSPTQSRDSTLTRPSDDRRRLDSKKSSRRKSSLYMPLSLAYPVKTSRISPGSRVSSRSAPATPCGALVPNLLTFSQRISTSRGSRSSKCDEESNPLLVEDDHTRTDNKF